MGDYRKLRVTERIRRLISTVYRISRHWPREEIFGLTSQARRAAVSIGANVAEGSGRNKPREFAHRLNIALGSACETEFLWNVAGDLGYAISDEEGPGVLDEIQRIRRMLARLRRRVETNSQ